MTCGKCGSKRIIMVSGKCNDLCFVRYDGSQKNGYVPRIPGTELGGDYIVVEFCCDCGQLCGDFPLPNEEVKEAMKRM